MHYQEMQSLVIELQRLGFILGLTMFAEGAQGFYGNLRLLLDPYLFQENEHELYQFIQRRGLKIDFCFRAETMFIMISS